MHQKMKSDEVVSDNSSIESFHRLPSDELYVDIVSRDDAAVPLVLFADELLEAAWSNARIRVKTFKSIVINECQCMVKSSRELFERRPGGCNNQCLYFDATTMTKIINKLVDKLALSFGERSNDVNHVFFEIVDHINDYNSKKSKNYAYPSADANASKTTIIRKNAVSAGKQSPNDVARKLKYGDSDDGKDVIAAISCEEDDEDDLDRILRESSLKRTLRFWS